MSTIGFQQTAQASDELLAHDSSPGWLANPALHPLRDHPALHDSLNTPESIRFRQLLGLLRAWGVQFVASISRLRSPDRYLKALVHEHGSESDLSVLFVSHDVPSVNTDESFDIYFGAIPSDLNAYVIAIDHGSLILQVFGRTKSSSRRVIIPPGLGLVMEAKIMCEALAGFTRVLREIRRERDPARRNVLRKAFLRSADAVSNLRIGCMAGIATGALKPDVLVLTFEGHPWERLAINEAKRVQPELIALAYPHAGILPKQHSLFRTLANDMDPDGFLAPGNLSAIQLKGKLPKALIQVLGSPRLLRSGLGPTNEKPTCLVLPEGLLSETQELINASSSLAKLHPQINFVIRLHPALARGRSLQKLLSTTSSVPNILVSDGSLENDASRSQWCLYRGSTAAVMVVATGVFPIYLHQPGSAVIDPLSETWDDVTFPEHAATSIEEVTRRLTEDYDCGRCVEAARNYFTAPDPSAVFRLVHLVRNARIRD